jgi:hypothetical protein
VGTAALAHKVRLTPLQEVLRTKMLWIIVALLVLLWIGGFAMSVGGSLIHLLLVLAIIVAIYNLFVTRGRTV